jgi:hypothetical protein
MGLFDKLKGPVFYKDDSNAEQQLHALENLMSKATGTTADAIAREIYLVKAGIAGEQQVRFELENSHIPMYVLHDLYLEYKGLTAQIDFLIITHYHQYIVECKNLFGDIEISSNGDFTRTMTYGKYKKKEGIYSPITQNRRHLELIKELRGSEKNILAKVLFDKNFYESYRSVVVLSNPKTVLNARFAKKEVKEQVIRADQLAEFIRSKDTAPGLVSCSEKDMKSLAQFFAAAHKECKVDYAERFREILSGDIPEKTEPQPQIQANPDVVKCPRCGAPMVKRKATKGENAGKEFFGCSNYPKCRGIVQIYCSGNG